MTKLFLKCFVKDYEEIQNPKVRQSVGQLSGSVGIFCNVLLFLIKLLAGMMTGAVSVMADAFNNLSDAASSAVTLIGFYMAGKPADPKHPFGHGRIEYVSGLFVSAAILFMGYELMKSSVDKILHPQELTFQMLSVVILLLSIGVKLWLSFFYRSLGKKISSETILAAATDSLSDCISTAAVLGGICSYGFLGWNLDGYLGALVAVLILLAGINAAKETIQPLLGTAPDPKIVAQITETVMEEPMVLGIHDMVIHDYGPGRRMVSLHAEVSYMTDILEAHDVIDNIEQRIEQRFQYEATIHMDPVVDDDLELQEMKTFVEKLVEEEDPQWKIHDFRMVRGNTHTNVIFDLVVPLADLERKKEIEFDLKKKIHETDSRYYAVIKVEQSYV